MSWPTDDIETSSLDSGSDKPNRRHFLTLFNRVKELIAARGAQNGVASLGANSKVPAAQLPRGEADGVASLDASSKVPAAQLPRGEADGVASLDASSKVPAAQLPRGEADGVASLDASSKVPAAQLAASSAATAVTATISGSSELLLLDGVLKGVRITRSDPGSYNQGLAAEITSEGYLHLTIYVRN